MRPLIFVLVAACGGGAGDSPRAFCQGLAATWCDRYYACYSPDQIAAAGLPVSSDECAREIELRLGCAEVTEANACPTGRTFDGAAASTCVASVGDRVCSQLADPDDVEESCASLCTSGTDEDVLLRDLSIAELTAFCEASVAAQGGPGTTTQCGDFTVTVGTVEACVDELGSVPADCTATLGDAEACSAALVDDRCAFDHPACAPLAACAT